MLVDQGMGIGMAVAAAVLLAAACDVRVGDHGMSVGLARELRVFRLQE